MRKVFLLLGAVLGIVVAGGIFLFIQSTRPTLVEVPVAIGNIPAGTVLKPYFFRVVRMSNVDQQTLSKWVTLADWSMADSKATTSDIRAGFPVAKSQIDPNSPYHMETRLSEVLSGTNDYYMVIPTNPNETGMYLQPGDRIDLIISIGNSRDTLMLGVTQTASARNVSGAPAPADAGIEVTQTLASPFTKLVMQNMYILRIDRDKPKDVQTGGEPNDPQLATGNITRLYIRVNRDQLEVLTFVLNAGHRTFVVRAANGSQDSLPTDGVTWDDFARWFYAQRGNHLDSVQPFDTVSPSEPPQKGK
jgi:hypothetical protein